MANETPIFVGAGQAAKLLSMSRTTFWRISQSGDFPAPFRIHAKSNAIYKAAEVIEWLESKREVADATKH